MSQDSMTALVVDDEVADLEMLGNALADLGYKVITASDGVSALREFNALQGAIDLLVTDIAMAPMNGCELAANLLGVRPDLRVVFVSGYAGTEAFRYEHRLTRAFPYLRKPLKAADLQAEVRDVLAAVG
jgi:two-component system, cell cycle sensor histidine kinase and response regulator CckA